MAKDLRSQLKPTKINNLKKAVDSDNNIIGVVNNEYLSLEDGKKIKIRIFPAHPGQERFYVPKKSYWLSRINDDGDTKRFTVLDSVVHGGFKMDIVDQYSKMVKKRFAKNSKIIDAVSGDRNSLNPSYTWVAYAAKVSGEDQLNPILWEFKKMVRDSLNKLAFSEEEDEPIEIDPFTDPDNGIPVMVTYHKKPNKKAGENYYEVAFPKNAKPRPLADEEIEAFLELKPLDQIIATYSKKDFDRALEGIQNFDEEYDVNLFDDDEWLELVEQIKSQFDDDEEDDDEPAKPKKKVVKKVVEEDDDEEEPVKKPLKKTIKKSSDDEEDEDDEPAKKPVKKPAKKVVEEDDEDEDEEEPVKKPSKKPAKKVVEEDDDEEDDEEPTKPVKKTSKKKVVEEDEDDDDEEDEDEVPAKKPKLSIADIRQKMSRK